MYTTQTHPLPFALLNSARICDLGYSFPETFQIMADAYQSDDELHIFFTTAALGFTTNNPLALRDALQALTLDQSTRIIATQAVELFLMTTMLPTYWSDAAYLYALKIYLRTHTPSASMLQFAQQQIAASQMSPELLSELQLWSTNQEWKDALTPDVISATEYQVIDPAKLIDAMVNDDFVLPSTQQEAIAVQAEKSGEDPERIITTLTAELGAYQTLIFLPDDLN